jgi:ABC-2 type transport system permease protein
MQIRSNWAESLSCFAAQSAATIRAALNKRTEFALLAGMMCLNNIVYFLVWLLFFRRFSAVGGWTVVDMATLHGLMSMGFGLAFAFGGGSWVIGDRIRSGALDAFLTRPRRVLGPLLVSQCRVSSFGDIASAFVIWGYFGNKTLADLPLLILLATSCAVILISVMVLLQSVAFWGKGGHTLPDQLFEAFLMLSLNPQQGLPKAIRIALVTIIPAGFVAFVPVELVRHFSVPMLLLTLGAATFYAGLAIWVFQRGLGRYISGNGMG